MLKQRTTARGHQHVEAFCLMRYHCESCGHRERIWNSRDGVTPFGCGCPSCGKTMRHIDFAADEYAPKHELHYGQRFWRDGTPDEAEAIMRKRIDMMRDKYPVPPEDEARLIKSARDGDDDSEFRAGWPAIGVNIR